VCCVPDEEVVIYESIIKSENVITAINCGSDEKYVGSDGIIYEQDFGYKENSN